MEAIAVAPLAIMVFFAVGLGIALIAWWGRSRRSAYQAEYPPMVRPVGCGHRRRSVWGVMGVLIGFAAVLHLYAVRSERARPAAVATPTVYAPEVVLAHEAGGQVVVAATQVRQDRPAKQNWMTKKKPAAKPAEPGVVWKGTIERGCVISLADSKEEILDTIRQGLDRELSLSKAPSPAFVANPAWVRFKETAREPLAEQTPTGDTVVRILYAVEVTPQGWDELAREQRVDRAASRMELAARGLGLLTVLLGAVAGYVRVDEWTKGYYSGRLFLAATALVAGAGAVIVAVA
jgi:hypothetical protein